MITPGGLEHEEADQTRTLDRDERPETPHGVIWRGRDITREIQQSNTRIRERLVWMAIVLFVLLVLAAIVNAFRLPPTEAGALFEQLLNPAGTLVIGAGAYYFGSRTRAR
ncbi:hypothetical protein [Flindersiella endophytica]